MRMAQPEENADPTADPWAEFIRVTAPEFAKPTIEQIATVTKPIWEALVAGAQYSHGRLMEIWEDVRPDVVCTDNVTGYPGGGARGLSMGSVRLGQPAGDARPRPSAGAVGAAGRRPERWQAFRDEYHRQHEDLLAEHNGFRASVGVAPCPLDEFNTNSPWVNLYLFPEVGRLPPRAAARRTWHRLNSTVRTSDAPSTSPNRSPATARSCTCRSGRSDAWTSALMQRLIDAMAKTEHRTIVSMGPLKEQMTLGPNMYGDQFLPQPSILPQCDLLITHGGNNTVCEGFHFGLPMIGLPLFWDQYDNAQRLRETGFGERLPTYGWTDDE